MRIVRWGAAATAALAASVPFAAQAATSPTTSTGTSGTATQPVGGTTQKVSSSVPGVPTKTPTSSSATATKSTAQNTVTTPAPAGTSEGYAAKVGNVAAVSHTKASASGSGESSTADPVEIGGNPPASVFGGSKDGAGDGSGALLDTGTQPFGRIAVTPWTVSNSSSDSGNSASGLADILLVDLGSPGTSNSVSLQVLQSESRANWTPAESTSSSSTDGAILDVGGPNGLVVDLLHSQTSSSGAGSSYLVSINGNQIGSSQQAGGKCALTIPGVLSLDCLTATGGTGATGVLTSTGGVASVTVGPSSSGPTAELFQAASSSGRAPASTSPASGSGPATGPGTGTAPAAAPVAAPAASGAVSANPHKLAFTGGEIVPTVLASAGLLGTGAALVGVTRRRRRREATRTA